ncbi:MAG: ATP-binding protein [Candidatus Goldbacteria bacterium]|nr:ATP-binding protein [Candidatus Goldiibacteriota bacterium]
MKKSGSKKASEYSIEIPKDAKYFFLIRKFVENIMNVESISEKERDDIILAVNEACDKLFRLAPDDGKNIKVDIRLRITPQKIQVVLRHKSNTELSIYLKKIDEDRFVIQSVQNKIGDYLMEKSSDEVNFISSKRKGKLVKITKYRSR